MCYKMPKTSPIIQKSRLPRAVQTIRRFEELHAHNLRQKTEIIVETFRDTTRGKNRGQGKMMVVAASRLAAVRYYREIQNYLREQHDTDTAVFVAFSGMVKDGDAEYTENGMNRDRYGRPVSESQLRQVFHEEGDILIVAEKYQTGFDEPLLHTMIVDKKLRGVKAVQTLSRLKPYLFGQAGYLCAGFCEHQREIKEAFQPFYKETVLDHEIDVDLIYKTQGLIHDFGVYTREDVAKVGAVRFSGRKNAGSTQARITAYLKPVVDVYDSLGGQQRYEFRRLVRSLHQVLPLCGADNPSV